MNRVITISREFRSGGREIGKRLADELGFAYYDKEIIEAIAKETGMSEEYIKNISEKGMYPYAFQFAKSFAMYSLVQSNQTKILVAQQKILKEYMPMNIFVYADMESKLKRCKQKAKEEEKLTDKEMESKMIQIDKNRKNYNAIISNMEWGDKKNYHLCINTSGVEIKTMIPSLSSYIKDWFGGR